MGQEILSNVGPRVENEVRIEAQGLVYEVSLLLMA